MSDIAIKVENLSKLYQLGEVGTGTLSKDLNRLWARVRGKEDPYAKFGQVNDRTQKAQSDFVWALKEINFEVKQGEVIGIIGRNGSGKSTILKILSKITSPTTGKIYTKGRIASLLEVGTGFHPEMTGRENIYLNGTILGMRKWEIVKKIDEIVDFSGVEAYIDTPVKRYSSGMYVRLAFAVAAHLEPEILIIDEVLAVGDAEFQKKCLGKMNDISKQYGRTVLFVSHSMGSVAQLCSYGLLLENGNLTENGNVNHVIERYLTKNVYGREYFQELNQDKEMLITEAFLEDLDSQRKSAFLHTEEISIKAKIKINVWVPNAEFRLVIRDIKGKAIFTSDYELTAYSLFDRDQLNAVFTIPADFLRPGDYTLTFAIFVPHQLIVNLAEDVISFKIVDGGSKYAASEGLDYGYIFYKPAAKFK